MGRTPYAPSRAGTVKAQCWCRCGTVNVSLDAVRRGVTESCGRRLCNALEFTALMGSADPSCDDCAERNK